MKDESISDVSKKVTLDLVIDTLLTSEMVDEVLVIKAKLSVKLCQLSPKR